MQKNIRGHLVELRPLPPKGIYRSPFAIYIDGKKATEIIEYQWEIEDFIENVEREFISPRCICGWAMGWVHGPTVESSDGIGERYQGGDWDCGSMRKHEPKIDPNCVFSLMQKEVRKNNLLIAHGDLDGIISAVLLIQELRLAARDTEIHFAQPFTMDKVKISNDIDRVYVVDIAVNNRDPEMTKNFIHQIGDRLVVWYDHHQGWADDLGAAFVINTSARSCAAMIGGKDFALAADATVADSRKGKLSPRAQLIECAMKANMADDNIRLLAVKWLLGDETGRKGLEEAAKKYAEIQAETERLAATYHVTGNVALVDARQSNHQYDLTQLLLVGQKMAPFAVAQTVHPQQGEGLTIATSRKDVNLVELFDLGSGAPFRVSLPAKRQEEALTKLATV